MPDFPLDADILAAILDAERLDLNDPSEIMDFAEDDDAPGELDFN
jgi:hypothetical protein